jgi:cytochrome c oxidase assembly protein subunit 15
MPPALSDRWLHRLAWLTALVALLPISVGAVVTTVDAGMAFADWPTSDGHGMLSYPWLQSTGDKFLEHGHRLAGMLIGVMTLVLTWFAFTNDTRPAVRTLVGVILMAVIGQGLLGGSRVVQNERLLAFLHGQFAAAIFSLMGVLVAMTGRNWDVSAEATIEPARLQRIVWAALGLVSALVVQYVLGGMLRHLGSANAWLVHPWFAIAVALAAGTFFAFAWQTGSPTLRRAAGWVMAFVALQAVLGVATWAVRFGFPQWGLVAVQQSPLQVSIRSLHKVIGLLTFMMAVVAMVRTLAHLPRRSATSTEIGSPLLMAGGVR